MNSFALAYLGGIVGAVLMDITETLAARAQIRTLAGPIPTVRPMPLSARWPSAESAAIEDIPSSMQLKGRPS